MKVALLLAVVCAGIFLRAMDRDLNHDEHQFLAPAALLSREGLLPYRDYPLFHLPNLVLLYGALDRLTGELLLSAKCVSVASTCGGVILLFLIALSRTSGKTPRIRWLLGCFAPSRYQYQHYYVSAPLLVLGVMLGAAASGRHRRPILFAFASLVLLVVQSVRADGAGAFSWLGRIGQPADWFPAKAKAIGRSIGAVVPAGKVLTLAPTWVLEGGRQIYPEFATGPFAWRSARFASADDRRRLKLIAPEDLATLLERDPPAALLTGVEEKDLEAPLVAYAESHGYRPQKLTKRRLLWLPP